MTGKEMLKGIQNLDAGLIEEAEFAPYPKRKSFGKKKLLPICMVADQRV